jgi:hypothetical protein
MTESSLEHRIRVALGRAFHHRHRNGSGSVDIEDIAAEHGVSEDQVMEQLAWLRHQNLLGGPMMDESLQVAGVPLAGYDEHHLTDEGVAWAESGYPEA